MSSKKKTSKTTPEGTSETRLSRGHTRSGAIFPIAPTAASLPESYADTLQEIKTHLRSARTRAILAANPIVIEAYWQTGKIILARQPPKRVPSYGRALRAKSPSHEGFRP